ncbi:MAG TPA: isoamylase early set domain-containing protein [Anaerolineae bacterium]|nr:isoamylase early set domain-containing protein [Anaerolineae bacterium]HMR65123.1 isoamylase early set domain-containing protein [Anaerolineae bacterium]
MITKKFMKSKPEVQVTFELPGNIEASEAALVGEFNNWDSAANPLSKTKGVWKTTLKLETGKEYQFRYLVNGSEWYNDDAADKYVANNIDGENSVLVAMN